MFSHMIKNFKKHTNTGINGQIQPETSTSDKPNLANVFGDEFEDCIHLDNKSKEEINQNTRNAMWYYLRAALRGDKEAQYKMGLSYLNGQLGLDRSYIHAEKWLDQAAHQGHVEAKTELQNALNKLAFS